MNLFNRFLVPARPPQPRPLTRPPAAVLPKPAVGLRPTPKAVAAPPPVAPSADNDSDLASSKVVRQLAFIDRSYGLQLLPGGWGDFQDDLALMLQHRDLRSVCLELAGADQ